MTLHLSLYPYTRAKIMVVIIHKVYYHLPRSPLTPPLPLPRSLWSDFSIRTCANHGIGLIMHDGEVSTSDFKNVQEEVSF